MELFASRAPAHLQLTTDAAHNWKLAKLMLIRKFQDRGSAYEAAQAFAAGKGSVGEWELRGDRAGVGEGKRVCSVIVGPQP